MVVDGHRQGLLGPVLPDDVLAQGIVDLAGLGGVARRRRGLALSVQLLFNDLGAQFDALVADVDAGAGYELSHLLLRFAAEGALEFFSVPKAEHPVARHSRFTPARRACLAVTGDMDLLTGLHDVIDQPVLFRRLRIHPEVPVGVVLQALNGLPRMLG